MEERRHDRAIVRARVAIQFFHVGWQGWRLLGRTREELRLSRRCAYLPYPRAQYTLKVENRETWRKALSELRVPSSIHYPSGMHQQPTIVEMYGASPSIPVAEKSGEGVFSLPLYADMPMEHVESVVDAVKKVSIAMGS